MKLLDKDVLTGLIVGVIVGYVFMTLFYGRVREGLDGDIPKWMEDRMAKLTLTPQEQAIGRATWAKMSPEQRAEASMREARKTNDPAIEQEARAAMAQVQAQWAQEQAKLAKPPAQPTQMKPLAQATWAQTPQAQMLPMKPPVPQVPQTPQVQMLPMKAPVAQAMQMPQAQGGWPLAPAQMQAKRMQVEQHFNELRRLLTN